MVELMISVIVPTYNESAFLGKCLDSLAAQTRLPDEVIVLIDEKTTDNSGDIAINHPSMPRVAWGHRDTFTLQHLGVLEARGEVIVNVDADTYLAPNWIERALGWVGDPGVSLVTGHIRPHVANPINNLICDYQNGRQGYLSGCSSAMRRADYLYLCGTIGGPKNIEFAYYPFERIGNIIKDPDLVAETDIPTSAQKYIMAGTLVGISGLGALYLMG